LRLRLAIAWLRKTVPAWLVAVGIELAIVLLVAPWGAYPLNDDWQYARAMKLFAASGHIVIDTAIAPALVGQLLLVWPFVKVFGFGHVVLRSVTLLMACVVL
jgi:hypothetical protein